MNQDDRYSNIADYYDYMLKKNSERENFFRVIFDKYDITRVLDCACGTGNDLIMFHSLGCKVWGSDISEAMLRVAQKKISERKANIALMKQDFHSLTESFEEKFDAVVCLSNSLNEKDVDVIQALNSMKSVLRKDGIIIFDQGQTDFTMKNPPIFFPEVNDKDLSRLYTMNYLEDVMIVDVFDFIHKAEEGLYDFRKSEFHIRIRIYSDWIKILSLVGLTAEFYGSWTLEKYDKDKSTRLIIVAKNI